MNAPSVVYIAWVISPATVFAHLLLKEMLEKKPSDSPFCSRSLEPLVLDVQPAFSGIVIILLRFSIYLNDNRQGHDDQEKQPFWLNWLPLTQSK